MVLDTAPDNSLRRSLMLQLLVRLTSRPQNFQLGQMCLLPIPNYYRRHGDDSLRGDYGDDNFHDCDLRGDYGDVHYGSASHSFYLHLPLF